MYGTTFGRITSNVLKGNVAKGVAQTPEEEYKSINMASYTNPREKKYVNPLEPEPDPIFILEEGCYLPEDVINKFWAGDSIEGTCTDQQVIKRHQWSDTLRRVRK